MLICEKFKIVKGNEIKCLTFSHNDDDDDDDDDDDRASKILPTAEKKFPIGEKSDNFVEMEKWQDETFPHRLVCTV